MTAHAYLFWRLQAAVTPMTGSSDNTDVEWSMQNAAQNSDHLQPKMSPEIKKKTRIPQIIGIMPIETLPATADGS